MAFLWVLFDRGNFSSEYFGWPRKLIGHCEDRCQGWVVGRLEGERVGGQEGRRAGGQEGGGLLV